MMALAHGGNVYEVASRLGCSPDDILDYSASINPLGPPPGLAEELNSHFHRLRHYPDISNRTLVEAISKFHDFPPEGIVVGNGSTEIIYWLPKALGVRKAVVVLPTFSEYQKAFELQGVEIHKIVTSPHDHFQPSVDQLDSVCDAVSPEAILFTNPGSPSGIALQDNVRSWILRKCRAGGMTCIVDEVFVDFCESESMKEDLRGVPNLVLIRSMTKFYGIPGLRLGYSLCSSEIASRIRYFLPPWSVNALAQLAGVFCLGQDGYRCETLALTASEREHMADWLRNLMGCRPFESCANYLLVRLSEKLPPADNLQNALLASERILIRDCRSFEGLDDHYIRLAVRLPEQNQRLLEGLSRWFASLSTL